MNPEFLARLQFALTISFHYLFPPLSMGLGILIVIAKGLHLKTKAIEHDKIARFLTRIFALTFAVGVATGVIMEFQFGMNWSGFSRFAGDISSALLSSETLIAFFLESTFLAILVFGWDRVSAKVHFFSAMMVALGAHISAFWILVFNSWMNTPAGYKLVDHAGAIRAEVDSLWDVVFNPSSIDRIAHTVLGAWLSGSFLVVSIASYYLIKKRHIEIAKKMMALSLSFATVTLVLQFVSGHQSGQRLAKYQPVKLAAMEGLYKTQEYSPMSLMGIIDDENETIKFNIEVPGGLSFLAHNNFKKPVMGLDQVAKEDRPPIAQVYYSYHLMLMMWGTMISLAGISLLAWKKNTLWENKWLLRGLAFSFLIPQLGNQAGWFAAEVGRQPWLVQGLLRRGEGFSKTVPPGEMLFGIIIFSLIFILLLGAFSYVMFKKVVQGPENHIDSHSEEK